MIAGDFKTLFPVMDRKPKIKGTKNLNSTINQLALKDGGTAAAGHTFLGGHGPRSEREPKPQCRTAPRPPERLRLDGEILMSAGEHVEKPRAGTSNGAAT